jgi:hypothetical protein
MRKYRVINNPVVNIFGRIRAAKMCARYQSGVVISSGIDRLNSNRPAKLEARRYGDITVVANCPALLLFLMMKVCKELTSTARNVVIILGVSVGNVTCFVCVFSH